MGSNRDAIRAATVGAAKNFRSEIVKAAGFDIEVRQPSVKARGLILDSAGEVDPDTKKVKMDLAKLQISSVIACAFVPGTNEKAYDEADRESLEAMPAGGWFDEVAKAAQRMINVDLDDAKNA